MPASHTRRPVPCPARRQGATDPARHNRGPSRAQIHHNHLTVSVIQLVRHGGRPDGGRRNPRPDSPFSALNRAYRRKHAQTQGEKGLKQQLR